MTLKRKIWRKLRTILPEIGEAFTAPSVKQALIDQEIRAVKNDISANTPNNPALQGFKVYSQVDEDGIVEYLFARIGEGERTFVELGCGNGSENNTHYLALKGWKGVWVDGSEENINHIHQFIPANNNQLLVQRMFITRDNIAAAMRQWQARLGGKLDLLSLDIDGNDSIVLGEILTVCEPRVLVLEYNGKYPPPLKLSVTYDPSHTWQRDDYFGSSLQVFADQLAGRYQLVSCGVAGANAYFVRMDCAEVFTAYTTSSLFMMARPHLIHRNNASRSTLKFLGNVVKPPL